MARRKHRFSITIRDCDLKQQFTFHLCPDIQLGRYDQIFSGKKSKRYPTMTGTEIGSKIAGWLLSQQKIGAGYEIR